MKNTTILILLILSLYSCKTVQKLFTKEKSKTDSTSIISERKDSIGTIDTFSLKKSSVDEESGITIEFDTSKNWWTAAPYSGEPAKPIIAPHIGEPGQPNPNNNRVSVNDYYLIIDSSGNIKTNRPINKLTIKGKKTQVSVDSSGKKSETSLRLQNETSTYVKKSEKSVIKQVSKKKSFMWLWWLLLLIPAYVIYRNRKKIKAFILTILPI